MRKNIDKILSLDREEVSDLHRELFLKDFARVAGEYFEGDGNPTLEVTRSEEGFLLCVIWTARRVKSVKKIS